MKEIYTWYSIPRSERLRKVLKSRARDGCYFDRLESSQKDEKEWVEETDPNKSKFSEHRRWWKEGNPVEYENNPKPWWKFF